MKAIVTFVLLASLSTLTASAGQHEKIHQKTKPDKNWSDKSLSPSGHRSQNNTSHQDNTVMTATTARQKALDKELKKLESPAISAPAQTQNRSKAPHVKVEPQQSQKNAPINFSHQPARIATGRQGNSGPPPRRVTRRGSAMPGQLSK